MNESRTMELVVPQIVKFAAFSVTRKFITAFTTAATGPRPERDESSPHNPVPFFF
jgi:hypothetical protein